MYSGGWKVECIYYQLGNNLFVKEKCFLFSVALEKSGDIWNWSPSSEVHSLHNSLNWLHKFFIYHSLLTQQEVQN